MAGFQSLLARTTISQLLRALTPNDYFHILQVRDYIISNKYDIILSDRWERVTGIGVSDVSQIKQEPLLRMCWYDLSVLSPLIHHCRQAAGEVVMSLSDRNNVGRAQFDQPLRDSLMLLDNSMECHRVLIIFSDGDRETKISTDLVRKHNKDNKVGVAN